MIYFQPRDAALQTAVMQVGRAVLCAPFAIKISARRGLRALPQSATKRANIGPSFFLVDVGHNFRSVTSAVSNAECCGQFGSLGIRGMTSAMTRRAVSA